MKIAALILAHKNPQQLLRLNSILKEEGFSVFIHIDKKTYSTFRTLPLNMISKHNVRWGGFSTIKATIDLFKFALKSNADYYFLISGQDYLLKPKHYIEEQLGSFDMYMTWTKMPTNFWGPDGGMERLERYYFESIPTRLQQKILREQHRFRFKRSLPHHISFYGGSQWFTASHKALTYLVNKAPEYVQYFRNTLLPDEMMFQTIWQNSPYAHLAINDNLRLLSFHPLTGMAKTYSMDDLDSLQHTPKLFVRKIESETNTQLPDLLDKFRRDYK